MDLIAIYECLCDRTRLRLLHLLLDGPLCVCHFQEVLGAEQVKVSKHLAYLRRHRLVVADRAGNRRVYRLPEARPAALAANLDCLRTCAARRHPTPPRPARSARPRGLCLRRAGRPA